MTDMIWIWNYVVATCYATVKQAKNVLGMHRCT